MRPIQIFLSLLALIMIISSCRKGDEDPFLSLTSRKSRISGEWKMTSYHKERTMYSPGDSVNTIDITATETMLTSKISYYTFYQNVDTLVLDEYSITINKDGTWSKMIDYDFFGHYTDPDFSSDYQKHITETFNGTWSFVGKSPDYEKKERVTLNILEKTVSMSEGLATNDYADSTLTDGTVTTSASSYTITQLVGEEYVTYDILMLKSNEMKWQIVTGSENGGYSTLGLEEITWKAK